jgi:chromosome segregation ATPase
MRKQIEAAIVRLQDILANAGALEKVKKQLADTEIKLEETTAKLETMNGALANVEARLQTQVKALMEGQKANAAAMAAKRAELVALTREAEALKAQWAEPKALGEVTAALKTAQSDHADVMASMDSVRKRLFAD